MSSPSSSSTAISARRFAPPPPISASAVTVAIESMDTGPDGRSATEAAVCVPSPSKAQRRRYRSQRLDQSKDCKSPSPSSSSPLPLAADSATPRSRERDFGRYPDFPHPVDRDSRRIIAARTLEIVKIGGYRPMRGPTETVEHPHIDLRTSFEAARTGTRVIRVSLDELKTPVTSSFTVSVPSSSASASSRSASLSGSPAPKGGGGSTDTVIGSSGGTDGVGALNIRISSDTSVAACLALWNARCARTDGAAADGFHLAVLNFASGKNPGGGGVAGAQAQEESLIRVSSLQSCLDSPQAADFYREGRRCGAPYYAEALVWSPYVPFFSDDGGWLLSRDEMVHVSVLTAAAVNCRDMTLEQAVSRDVEECMERRAVAVLRTARSAGVTHLVLGAWGCGVFRSPHDSEYNTCRRVAVMFRRVLTARFSNAFHEVVFALAQPRGSEVSRGFHDGLFPRDLAFRPPSSAPAAPAKIADAAAAPTPKPLSIDRDLSSAVPASSSSSSSSSRFSSASSSSSSPSSSRPLSAAATPSSAPSSAGRKKSRVSDRLVTPFSPSPASPAPPTSKATGGGGGGGFASVPPIGARRWDAAALLEGVDLKSLGNGATATESVPGGDGGDKGGEPVRRNVTSPLPACVLVLSASVSPPHGGHLEMFTAAATHLRALGHLVLGGVLAPSSDEWVRPKFVRRGRGHLALSLAERVHLCRLAAPQVRTVAMHVCDWGWMSASRIMGEIRARLAAAGAANVAMVELAGTDVLLLRPGKTRRTADPGRILVGFARADADPREVARLAAEFEREAKTRGGRSSRHILRGTPTAALSSSHVIDVLFPSVPLSSSSPPSSSVSSSSSSPSSSSPSSSSPSVPPTADPMASLVAAGVLHPEVATWLAAKWSLPTRAPPSSPPPPRR